MPLKAYHSEKIGQALKAAEKRINPAADPAQEASSQAEG